MTQLVAKTNLAIWFFFAISTLNSWNASSTAAAADAGDSVYILPTPPAKTFSPIALRGYGKLSGAVWKRPAGSVLEIDCQDPDKAKLVQAKYLSDLSVLPGVNLVAGSPTIYEVDSQGCIAAFCDRARVIILTGNDKLALQSMIEEFKPAGITTAQIAVPMYLDRWDRFSFRHYYMPWTTPKGVKVDAYDFIGDFDYAKQEDRAGILVGVTRLPTDTADEILNTGWNDWTAHEAATHGLPVDVHLDGQAGFDPIWFVNHYRDQLQMKMPGFTGTAYGLSGASYGSQGVLSWNSTTGEDDRLADLQTAVRRYANEPNVVSVLEPHAETHHGNQEILLEYGSVADAAYRKYLQQKYGELSKVATRWQRTLNTWDDVRVPELVSFAGWGPRAIDVSGLWHVGYEKLIEGKPLTRSDLTTADSELAPKEWFDAAFDDSQWPIEPDGVNNKVLLLPKRPAVYRREFEVPADWKEKNPHAWLYVWDMNTATKYDVAVYVNGKEVSKSTIGRNELHWVAADVSNVVTAGKNVVAIRVPQGRISYKNISFPRRA